jgi:hypothetical protein
VKGNYDLCSSCAQKIKLTSHSIRLSIEERYNKNYTVGVIAPCQVIDQKQIFFFGRKRIFGKKMLPNIWPIWNIRHKAVKRAKMFFGGQLQVAVDRQNLWRTKTYSARNFDNVN